MLDFILKPWHLIVLFLASQLNRLQEHVIEYLRVENQVLREKLGIRNPGASDRVVLGFSSQPRAGLHHRLAAAYGEDVYVL